MKLLKIFILGVISFYFSSCKEVNEAKNIEGWWVIIPQEGTDSYNAIWSNQDSTVVFWGREVLEIPKGVRTPDRSYGNHLPYYLKRNLLYIFSPIEKEWQKYKIEGNGDEYQIKNQNRIDYKLIRTQPVEKYTYPEIQTINLVVLDDSLALIENPKRKEYLFDFDKKLVILCTDFYDINEDDFSLSTRILQSELDYLYDQVSRLSKSLPVKYEQKVSDVPQMKLTIKFKGGDSRLFEINDPIILPQSLKNLISYLSDYEKYVPFNPTRECKIK
ncbi:MAG TPA: hypothetical protein PKA00_18600 [Saprospiraceae bacterium]|nr:hypothetical protein [Saprospiraceae bacterium]HMQ84930.1 hypothetical protein [Saprospiraceae bacterium]